MGLYMNSLIRILPLLATVVHGVGVGIDTRVGVGLGIVVCSGGVDGVGVTAATGDTSGVIIGVVTGSGVTIGIGDSSGVTLGVNSGAGVGMIETVGVGKIVGVGVSSGEDVCVGLVVGLISGVGVNVGDNVGVGDRVGVGVAAGVGVTEHTHPEPGVGFALSLKESPAGKRSMECPSATLFIQEVLKVVSFPYEIASITLPLPSFNIRRSPVLAKPLPIYPSSIITAVPQKSG